MNPPRIKKPLGIPVTPGTTDHPTLGPSPSEMTSLALLLINEQAEEVKQATICMRQVYPGCRVEAVYSAEEALEWGPKHDWSVILLDEQLAHRHVLDLLPDLRQRAPLSVIIVQGGHHDAKTAAKALQAGADLFLYKKSPAFLTELPIVVRGMLEQRMLRKELAAERERHSCLIEHFPGLLYELNADGRFVAIGASVMALLGYNPQELVGTHYSTLLHPDEWQLARHHLHERRTGFRAQHDKPVRLIGKHGGVVEVACQTAGLYGEHRRFLGTVGIMKSPGESGVTAPAHPPFQGQSARGGPAPVPYPTIRESPTLYREERRRGARVVVKMEASLHLRDTAHPGFVRDISLADMYLVLKGSPAVKRDQQVRLEFFMDGAVLQVQGKITEVRHAPAQPDARHGEPGIGLVILYSDLGAIEKPILSSLLEELRSQPNCAKLTIFPSPARNVESA
jgi:PAS domain S-box-containing protein